MKMPPLSKPTEMNSRYKVLNVLFAGISVSVAALCAAGCADDSPFGEKPGELPDRPVFGVSMSSSWQTGQDATRSGVTVSPLEGDSTGQTLYLVTEVAAVNDSVIGPATRGSKVENEEDFTKAYASFGLTGICHQGNGDSDVSDLAPNLLHNGKITKKAPSGRAKSLCIGPGRAGCVSLPMRHMPRPTTGCRFPLPRRRGRRS